VVVFVPVDPAGRMKVDQDLLSLSAVSGLDRVAEVAERYEHWMNRQMMR
jgi:hypothetical protein